MIPSPATRESRFRRGPFRSHQRDRARRRHGRPEFRQAFAAHGYTLDPDAGEVAQLAPYTGPFSARAARITRNIERYEAQWRSEHPGRSPGTDLRRRWVEELHELGFTAPAKPAAAAEKLGTAIGMINRHAVADLFLSRLGARRSSWNAADIRGEVERIVASLDIVASTRYGVSSPRT